MVARKIIWSHTANKQKDEILNYWIWRNKSKVYSKKLNEIFNTSFKKLGQFPNIGQKTDKSNIRVLVIENYLAFMKF